MSVRLLMLQRYRLMALSVLVTTLLATGSASAQSVLILGDSISAAYGMEKTQGWVHLFQQRLMPHCSNSRVINASVSGETSAGGKSRLPELLGQHSPDIVVIELGGNDGLRGLSPIAMRRNLESMISLTRESGAKPVLLGMRIPPNYGPQYTRLFEQQFQLVAEQMNVPLMPFFLDGILEHGGFQQDGIHPSVEAQPLLLRNAESVLGPILPDCYAGNSATAEADDHV
ncbi:arylesterase [Alcanivorax sediminis]